MAALSSLQKPRQSAPKAAPRMIARAATDDEAVQLCVKFLAIGARCERSHAVPQQVERQFPRVFPPQPRRHLMQILHQRPRPVRIEIPQVLRGAHTLPVPAMDMDCNDKPLLRQEFHQWLIALLVLCHAVRDLQNAARAAGRFRNL